uniref:Suppressor of white apricot N-terminal domain-containing protein n=1 Tax=Plectus sambesii TaxID=2011161 RepID=A0A914VGF1_9BILA
MWHEARKQEKAIRSAMVDHQRRAERRKDFFDSVRRDPAEFMQVHGRTCHIHMDPNVARAAESSNSLRKWQGDETVLIDRFDARAHLEIIPEYKPSKDDILSDQEEASESKFMYERYRVLVINEFQKVSETDFLKGIAEKEHWPSMRSSTSNSQAKQEAEKKRKSADRKAAIGFSYDDSTTVGGRGSRQESSSGEDSDLDIEEGDFDLKFELESLKPEQRRELNKLGAKFRLRSDDFVKLFQEDRKNDDDNRELRDLEQAKLALAGKHARRERAILKHKRSLLVGKAVSNDGATTTLLSFAAKKESPSALPDNE